MAIQTIVSGSGFGGLTFPQRSPEGSPGATGYDFKPVARWTELPSQIFRDGSIVVGLQAYHSEGIKQVEFVLNGGETATVTEQQFNPNTTLPEYCVRINSSDVIGSVGEIMDNVELRAVITPNVGQVKILQHDKEIITGTEGTQLVMGVYGISGGYGTNFQDQRLHPGEYSFICSLLHDNSISTLPDHMKYMSPSGSDSNDGSRSNPVKTMNKCLELVRNSCATEASNLLTDSGKKYVDVSRGAIVLLEGEYNPIDNYLFSSTMGNGTDGNEFVFTKSSFFRVTGDPTIEKDLVIMRVPEEQALPTDGSGNVYAPAAADNPHIFQLSRKNGRLTLFTIQHLKIIRDNLPYGHTNWAFMFTGPSYFSDVSNQTFYNTVLFDDIVIDDLTFFKGYSEIWANHATTTMCFKDCTLYGGSETTSLSGWSRGNTIIKNVGDCIKQIGFACGNEYFLVNGITQVARRIWFDPTDPVYGKYSKFNGLYGGIRYKPHLLKSTAFATDSGFTFDHNNITGTLWQKINTDALFDVKTPFYKDLSSKTNVDTFTYNELGESVGLNPNTYFGNHNEPTTTCHPARISPFLYRGHMTTPEKTNKKYFGFEGDETPIGESVYDDFFEPYYMALVTTTGSEGGTSGFLLFQSDKPLTRGSDSNPNTQEYLFRFSGTTNNPTTAQASAGHIRAGGTGNFYHRKDSAKPYYYSWTETPTSVEPPRGGNDEPSDNILGSTSDDYPVNSYCCSGDDDSIHADQFQWFMTPTQIIFDGIERLENILVTYNEMTEIDGQAWNVDTNNNRGGRIPEESWTDIAFVNNLMSGSLFNYGSNSAAWSANTKNFLFFNNTLTNNAFEMRMGKNFEDGNTYGLRHVNASNVSNNKWSDYLEGVYGPAGVTLDLRSGHIVFRNNCIESMVGNLFEKALGLTYDTVLQEWVTGGNTGSLSHPCIFEYNYFWPFGTETLNAYNVMKDWDYFIDIPQSEGTKFKNVHPSCGGADIYNSNISPNYTPITDSGLVGGASGSEPFDLYRRRRIERSTAGAIEPDSINDESSYISTSVTSTNTSIDLSSQVPDSLYGRKFVVKAFKDGEELISSNKLRFENFSESSTFEDASFPNIYEFSKQVGKFGRSWYEVPDEPDVEDPSTDWLVINYGLFYLTIHRNGYGEDPIDDSSSSANENLVKFAFETVEQVNTFKNTLDNLAGSSLEIIITSPDDPIGTPYKFAQNPGTTGTNPGGGFVYNTFLENPSGGTLSISEELLPIGNTIINIPTGM